MNTIFTQTNITKSNTSQLISITFKELYQKITSEEMKETINRLRNVKLLSIDSYNHIKRTLPYFIGATFKDSVRNSNNFIQINHFVIDIDKLESKEVLDKLKNNISKDPRVAMLFTSPSNNGIKVVFTLENPINMLNVYSDFYKAFSIKFAKQYGVEKELDFTTSDATRICFLSYDATCYINNNPQKINHHSFINDFYNFTEVVNKEKNNDEPNLNEPAKPLVSNQQYKNIIATLNPKAPKQQKKYFVPEELNRLMTKLKGEFAKYQFLIDTVEDISYGKKIKVLDDKVFASFNVFFGKRGFTVVKTLVRNSDEEFLDLCVAITENVIENNSNYLNTKNLKHEERPTHQFSGNNEKNKEIGVIQLKTAR